jgi:transposase
MTKRYELSNEQWRGIEDLVSGKKGDPGRSGEDNRLFVNAVLWVLRRSGARWSHLPERYRKWKSVHKRFTRWAKKGGVTTKIHLVADALGRPLRFILTNGAEAVIPSKSSRKIAIPHAAAAYKLRNRIQRFSLAEILHSSVN